MSTQHGQGVGRLLEQIFAGHQVVDLSLPLAEGMPYTAPRHFMPSNGTMEALPLLAAAGPACVVDVTGLDAAEAGTSPRITPWHLEQWQAEHGAIDAGDVVLLRGGWDGHYLPGPPGRRYGDDVLVSQTAPGWPAPTQEAIDWLRTRGVRCVGTDGFSIGPADNGAAAHLAALPHGMTFVEALAGLHLLPPRGAWFLFLPIRLAGGTGSPGRALAVLPERRQDQEAEYQEAEYQEAEDQEAEHEAALAAGGPASGGIVRTRQIAGGATATYIAVLDAGEEAVSALSDWAAREQFSAGQVTGVGAFERAVVGWFDRAAKDYRHLNIRRQCEVLSLMGDIARGAGDDGTSTADPQPHLHAVLGLHDGTTRGGHLLEGHVWPTLEVIIREAPAELRKTHHPEVGLALIDLDWS